MRKLLLLIMVLFTVSCIPEEPVIDKPIFIDIEGVKTELVVSCANTTTGYECDYQDPPEVRRFGSPEIMEMDERIKAQCEADGGKYKCYGFCTPSYTRFCDFPYQDAGKSCSDNSECTGFCIADEFECKSDCTGTCATYRLSMCDDPTELRDGVVFYTGILCD